MSEAVKHLDHRIVGKHPNAQYVHENGFFVGNHPFDIRDDLDYLKHVLLNVG